MIFQKLGRTSYNLWDNSIPEKTKSRAFPNMHVQNLKSDQRFHSCKFKRTRYSLHDLARVILLRCTQKFKNHYFNEI